MRTNDHSDDGVGQDDDGDHSGIARGPPKIMSRMHMTSMIIVMMQQINESLQDLYI